MSELAQLRAGRVQSCWGEFQSAMMGDGGGTDVLTWILIPGRTRNHAAEGYKKAQ